MTSKRRWTGCCARASLTADGDRIEGLRDLLEHARAKRRELEQQADPDGEMQRYRDWLDEIEATEGEELDELLAEAEESDDERRKEVTRDLVEQQKMQRDLMSDRPERAARRVTATTSSSPPRPARSSSS